jgi:hypothetical protein
VLPLAPRSRVMIPSPSDFVFLQIHCPSCKLRNPNTAFSSAQRLTLPDQVELQSGHFDVADRLFHHMGELWKGSTQSMGDVKELIPEFYYMDEMFVNSSCLPLGTRQNGETVSDVVSLFCALCIPTFVTFMHALEQFKHTYIHTYIHTYTHACIHTDIHTFIHTYAHTCDNTHKLTHLHTSAHRALTHDDLRQVLPAWACGDPRKFVRVMRDALEGAAVCYFDCCVHVMLFPRSRCICCVAPVD